MEYCIDGYNFLFRVTKDYKTLLTKKNQILARLETWAEVFHLSITLIFDGKHKAPADAIRGHLRKIEIIYTHENQSADDYIVQHIQHHTKPPRVTVVSSDREVLGKSKQFGASTQTIEQFLSFLLKKEKKRKTRSTPAFRDTDFQIKRLCKIFEEKLGLKNQEEF